MIFKNIFWKATVIALTFFFSDDVLAQGGYGIEYSSRGFSLAWEFELFKYWLLDNYRPILIVVFFVFVAAYLMQKHGNAIGKLPVFQKWHPSPKVLKIAQIIKTNYRLPYEKMKDQSISAGVPDAEFEEAWAGVHLQIKNRRKIRLAIIVVLLFFGLGYTLVFRVLYSAFPPMPFISSCESIKNEMTCFKKFNCAMITRSFWSEPGSFKSCGKAPPSEYRQRKSEIINWKKNEVYKACESLGGSMDHSECEKRLK